MTRAGAAHRAGSKFDGTGVAEGGGVNEERLETLAKSIAKLLSGNATADAGGVPELQAFRKVRNGEHRLAITLVSDAVEESFGVESKRRDEARAWLRADLPLLSARTCFEALDFDYEAVMVKLERRWSSAP